MLISLNIRDFVIVERMDLEFSRGFTALTGETGAGKSILIDALALVLGERGDASVIRQGAARSEITAEFEIAALPALQRWLAEAELAGDDDCCVMRRVIDSGGRSRAFINGRAVPAAQLREAGGHLVDIHGQHEHQSLLRASVQREMLDSYGGHVDLCGLVAEACQRWQEVRQQLALLESNAAAFAAQREDLEWQVRELAALNLGADEWPQLQAEHARLAHAQSLVEGAAFAMDALSESEQSTATQLAAAHSRLTHLLEYDPALKDVIEVISSAQAQTQEAVYMLRDYQQALDIDPQRFRQTEQRLDAVLACARKYRTLPEHLAETLVQARARLDGMGQSANADELRARVAAARDDYVKAAHKLTAARRKGAKKLAEKVTASMQTLAMAGGAFDIALTPLAEGSTQGMEQPEFLVSAHKGTPPRPLAKVASGGELSRISLALQTVASELARVPTLIFDEVDAGIGGRVAEIVGQMLKRLGREYQVMCVTHLPQVAASADQQWQVTKNSSGDQVSSRVAVLDDAQRIEEVARMLGGVKITETTRKHAAEMLKAVGSK